MPNDTSVSFSSNLEIKNKCFKKNKSTPKLNLPAREHDTLNANEHTLRTELKAKLPKANKDAKGDPKPNLLMVNMGFQLSEPTNHRETFISMPIQVDGADYFSIQNSLFPDEKKGDDLMYTENDDSLNRSHHCAARIEERHQAGVEHSPQTINFNKVQEEGPYHYAESKGPTYENKFHHSEQALYEYFVRFSTAEKLAAQLKQYSLVAGTAIVAITIDMNSTRYVCGNCELGMQGLTSAKYRFLRQFRAALKEQGITLKLQKTPIILRVIAQKPDGKSPKKAAAEHESIKIDAIRKNYIFQADASVIKPESAETDFHRRTVFISSEVTEGPSKSTYTSVLHKLQNREYSQMIAAGFCQKNELIPPYIKDESDETSIETQKEFTEDQEEITRAFIDLLSLEPENKNLAEKVRKARENYSKEIKTERNEHHSDLNDDGFTYDLLEQFSSKQKQWLYDHEIEYDDFIQMINDNLKTPKNTIDDALEKLTENPDLLKKWIIEWEEKYLSDTSEDEDDASIDSDNFKESDDDNDPMNFDEGEPKTKLTRAR